MSSKKARREAARKKARQKKMTVLIVCMLAVAAIAALIIVNLSPQSDGRVFVAGNNQVTLYEDGSFTAELPHGVSKSGTYMEIEHIDDDATTISFTMEGRTEVGSIIGDTLTIPHEWDDGHGHATEFVLR